MSDGARRWTVDTRERYQADPGFFGFGCSPLVVGDQVLLDVRRKGGAGLAAFDTASGRLLWKLKDQEAGYASPVVLPDADPSLALFFNREGLVGVSAFAHPVRNGFRFRGVRA